MSDLDTVNEGLAKLRTLVAGMDSDAELVMISRADLDAHNATFIDRAIEITRRAVLDERERCAKIAEATTCGSASRCNSGDCATANHIAERIRSGE